MIKNILLILFSTFLMVNAFAQVNIDSLEQNLKNFTKKDSIYVLKLNEIGWAYIGTDGVKVLEYAEQVYDISQDVNYIDGIIRGANLKGVAYWILGDYDKSLEWYQKALDMLDELGQHSRKPHITNNIALIYSKRGEYFKAFQLHKENYRQAEISKDTNKMCISLINMSEVLYLNENYQDALDAQLKLEALFKNRGNAYLENPAMTEGLMYNGTGNIYLALEDTVSAAQFFIKAIRHNEKRMPNSYVLVESYINQVNLELAQKDYEAAEYYINLAENLAKKNNFLDNKANVLARQSELNFQQKKWKEAVFFGKKTLKFPKKDININHLLTAYKNLYLASEKLGNYKAASQYITQYSVLKDSVNAIRNANEIDELMYEKQTMEKEAENRVLSAKLAAQEEKLKQRQIGIGTVFSVLTLMLALALYYFIGKRRTEQENITLDKMVKERKQNLVNSNTKLIEKNQQLERFAYTASHDLKEPLRNISGFMELLEMELKGDVTAKMKRHINTINYQVEHMRVLIQDILTYIRINEIQKYKFSHVNTRDILQTTISTFSSIIEQKNVSITTDGDLPTIYANKKAVEKLFKQLIGNGIKFNDSANPEIIVKYELKEDKWHHFYFTDNGIGIAQKDQENTFKIFTRGDNAHLYEGTGVGLAICHKITRIFGGTITVSSDVGEGSTFKVTLPNTMP